MSGCSFSNAAATSSKANLRSAAAATRTSRPPSAFPLPPLHPACTTRLPPSTRHRPAATPLLPGRMWSPPIARSPRALDVPGPGNLVARQVAQQAAVRGRTDHRHQGGEVGVALGRGGVDEVEVLLAHAEEVQPGLLA